MVNVAKLKEIVAFFEVMIEKKPESMPVSLLPSHVALE